MKKLPLFCLVAAQLAGKATAQQNDDPLSPGGTQLPAPAPAPAPVLPLVPAPPLPQPPPAAAPPLPGSSPAPAGPSSTAGRLESLAEKLDALGNLQVENTNFRVRENIVTLTPRNGLLHVARDGIEVFAKGAHYNLDTSELRFAGDVAVYRGGLIYRGENASYNVNSGRFDAMEMRSSVEPLFFKAGSISASGGSDLSVINLDAPEFTTDDSEDPSYRLTADRVSIYPGDRVVFRKVKILAGNTPVFYLPYLSQPLDGEFGYVIIPGYRSTLGAFLLNQYSTTLGSHSLAKYRLDLYSSRGAGAGLELESRRWPRSSKFGKFQFYWLYDDEPQTSNTGSTGDRSSVDNSRYRINLHHRVYLPDQEKENFYVDIDINKVSDGFFYEDFFQAEFRDDPQPDNIVNLVKRHDRGELSLHGRFRINDFYDSDSRLPEIAMDRVRQPVFNTGLFYSGNSSFGILEEHMSEDDERLIRRQIDLLPDGPERDTLRASLINPAFHRSHSWHELYYPLRFVDGAFTLTPRAGAGYTHYSSIDGPRPDDSGRFLFSAGLDASFKMSRVYNDVDVPALGLDGLRHIVQPYATWSFVSADDPGGNFAGIDRLVASTRPRPLEVSNFTAIDSLRDWHIVRMGVSNRLQTRRDRTTFNWLSANTYIDAFIDDPEYDRDFSNLYQDVTWNPVPWAKLSIGAQVPVFDDPGNFREVNTRATFMPTNSVELSIGHRMLSGHPVFRDSSLIDFGAYTRLNENWGFSIYERYETDDSTFETQRYSIHRDLTSWVASVGAIIRDHREETEWGVLLSLTLKDFPGVRVPMDFDP